MLATQQQSIGADLQLSVVSVDPADPLAESARQTGLVSEVGCDGGIVGTPPHALASSTPSRCALRYHPARPCDFSGLRRSPVVEHGNRWFALPAADLGRPRQSRRPACLSERDDRRPGAFAGAARSGRSAGADRIAGGVGGRRHVLPQPHRAHGRVQVGRRRRFLRSRLRRRPSGAVLQGQPAPRPRIGRDRAHPPRRAMERARAGADPGGHVERRDRRVHHRQRHELARHRGRKPVVPAAGQGVRRQLRIGTGHLRHAGAAAVGHRDPDRDSACRRRGVCRRDIAGRHEADAARAGGLSVSRQQFPARLPAADRHRHRAARRLHAGRGRRGRRSSSSPSARWSTRSPQGG